MVTPSTALAVKWALTQEAICDDVDVPEDPKPVVGWPGGFAPPGSHRSGRNSLPLSGSSHPPISQHERTHFHWANRSGCLSISPTHHRLNRLKDRNRRYFFPAQRLR
jgi:hypothetical protein